MLNVQVAPTTTHGVGVPVHPLNTPPLGGVSVKVTAVLNAMLIAQFAVPAAGPQLIPPPSPVTVPPAIPARFTVSRKLLFVKSAVALVRLVLLTVNTHGFTALALHGPAVQFVNEYPVPGVAAKLTEVPDAKFVEHALGGAGFAQLISVAIVGVEVLVIAPLPVNATVKLLVCAVNSALTVWVPFIATTHLFSDVINTHGPVQPPKFDVGFGSAVNVLSCPLAVRVCAQVPVVLVPFIAQSMIVPVPPIDPVTVPPPVAPLPAGVTVSAGVPVPRLNVAISASGFSLTVSVHVVLVAGHCVGVTAPLHPANTEPGLACSVKVTTDPFAYVVSQLLPTPPCPFALVQLI
jgi:hypothetical protein